MSTSIRDIVAPFYNQALTVNKETNPIKDRRHNEKGK
jgi:hypothetical protein